MGCIRRLQSRQTKSIRNDSKCSLPEISCVGKVSHQLKAPIGGGVRIKSTPSLHRATLQIFSGGVFGKRFLGDICGRIGAENSVETMRKVGWNGPVFGLMCIESGKNIFES